MSVLWLLLHRDPVAPDLERDDAVDAYESRDSEESDPDATLARRTDRGAAAPGRTALGDSRLH